MRSLTVWRNNRLDQEESIPLEQLAEGFLHSEYADAEMVLERAVGLYLMNVEHATWEDRQAFGTLCDLIVEKARRKE